jgi:tetratricopeptide (TPR) repeat protein
MEPIGTITMYFPFLDDESREIMQNIMDEAYNYYDFVQRLNERVLNDDVPELAAYFALHHSALLLDIDSIDSISKKYGTVPILRPNLFYASVHQGNYDAVEQVHASADAVLETDPPDWLAVEMRFLKFEVDLLQYPKTLYDTSNLEVLEELISKSPKYEFFENILYDCYRERATRDADTDEIIRSTELAIESAEKHDDIVRLAWHLRTKSTCLRGSDVVQARDALLRAREIMESLGNDAGLASTLLYLSRLDATRGEYNLAIERVSEAIRIRERMELPVGAYALMLSTLHNVVRDPMSGLEWGRFGEEDFESHPGVKHRAILNQAWSLILLRLQNKAQELIDSVRESIMKSGFESNLAWLYFVTGVFEMAEGNLETAARNMEDAIDLYEGKPSVENALIIMQYLAQIDLLQAELSSRNINEEGIVPWLALLEEKAISDDLPGILGQVLLLKVKLAIARRDEGALRELTDRIRILGESSSMTFLNEELERLLKQV